MDSLLSGSIAGIVADVATHPLGTVKTRLQVQGASASSLTRYGGVAQGLTRILSREGVGALYKGVGPRITRVMFEVAITMSLYGEVGRGT